MVSSGRITLVPTLRRPNTTASIFRISQYAIVCICQRAYRINNYNIYFYRFLHTSYSQPPPTNTSLANYHRPTINRPFPLRLGAMSNCNVSYRYHIPYRVRYRTNFPCAKANNGCCWVAILRSKHRTIRVHRSNKGTNRSIHALNSASLNFTRNNTRRYIRITRINIIIRLAFRTIRRIIYVCRQIISVRNFIRQANRGFIRTRSRFTPRMFFIRGPSIMFSIYKAYRFATRLNSAVQATHFFRLSTI